MAEKVTFNSDLIPQINTIMANIDSRIAALTRITPETAMVNPAMVSAMNSQREKATSTLNTSVDMLGVHQDTVRNAVEITDTSSAALDSIDTNVALTGGVPSSGGVDTAPRMTHGAAAAPSPGSAPATGYSPDQARRIFSSYSNAAAQRPATTERTTPDSAPRLGGTHVTSGGGGAAAPTSFASTTPTAGTSTPPSSPASTYTSPLASYTPSTPAAPSFTPPPTPATQATAGLGATPAPNVSAPLVSPVTPEQAAAVRNMESWKAAVTGDKGIAPRLATASFAGQQEALARVWQQQQAVEAATPDHHVELTREEVRALIEEILDEDEGAVDFDDDDLYRPDDWGGEFEPSYPDNLSPDDVSFVQMEEESLSPDEIADVINAAADLNGVPNDPEIRERWVNVMTLMANHESGFVVNAGNGWDSNANGARMADGFPANSSRGLWQTIPTTFAANHIAGTSNSIYDPIANAAAAMNYMMNRYNIAPDSTGLEGFALPRGIDPDTGNDSGGYFGY